MMQIFVKLLANYQIYLPEGINGNQVSIEVPENSTPEDVIRLFSIPPIPESVVLINGRTMIPGQALKQGDVVCAFSAMAGG